MAPGDFGMGESKDQRMRAERYYDRTTFALLPIFHADQPPVLSRAHPKPQKIAIMKLHAVGAGVDEAAFDIGY